MEVVDEVCAVGLRDRRLRRLNRKEGPIGTGRRLADGPGENQDSRSRCTSIWIAAVKPSAGTVAATTFCACRSLTTSGVLRVAVQGDRIWSWPRQRQQRESLREPARGQLQGDVGGASRDRRSEEGRAAAGER